MGKYNSSLTRVVPVFSNLLKRDITGRSWLRHLLTLFEHGHPHCQTALEPTSAIQEWNFGKHEKKLIAPRKLLSWLVEHADSDWMNRTLSRHNRLHSLTMAYRKKLAQKDPATIQEAINELHKSTLSQSAWFILEGPSQPDLFLITPDLILVLEGKRTESGPTLSTDYMPIRPQMLRHLDAAWEVRDGRKVLGGLIVEGQVPNPLHIPEHWQMAAHETIKPQVLNDALPHRSTAEKQEIAGAFLGVTTWQKICQTLNLDFSSLPDIIDS